MVGALREGLVISCASPNGRHFKVQELKRRWGLPPPKNQAFRSHNVGKRHPPLSRKAPLFPVGVQWAPLRSQLSQFLGKQMLEDWLLKSVGSIILRFKQTFSTVVELLLDSR